MGPCNWLLAPSCDDWAGYTPDQQTKATSLASMVMWAATGRRFGLCDITIQPCNPAPLPPLYQAYPVELDALGGGSGLLVPTLEGGIFYSGPGGGSCRSRCEVPLAGPTTTANVTEVTVNGEVVDPAVYQVHDGHLLVRVDGLCWPSCTGHTDPTFTVRYKRGEPVPQAVTGAAEVLACEFAKSIVGGKCRLPNRLASLTRQGVEVQVEQAVDKYLDRMLTNITEVDRVIVAVNPGRLQARPQVLSPDLPPPRMVT